MKSFEELRIWQDARVFVNSIYDLTENIKDYGFKDQIQRAAVSVMNNIAEGFDYGSDTMFIKYLDISKASCGEVKSMLYLAEDRKFCSKEKSSEDCSQYFKEHYNHYSGAQYSGI